MRYQNVAVSTVLLGLLVSSGAAAQDHSDEAQIRRVLQAYVEGWKAGDAERLGEVLAPNGTVMWTSETDGVETLQTMTFAAIIERGRSQRVYELTSVVSLDIVDETLAVAKVDIERAGGSYIDYLVLYKLGEEWRIVNKAFVVR